MCGKNEPYTISQELSADLFGLFCSIIIFSLTICLTPADGWTSTSLPDEADTGWTTLSLTEADVKVAPINELIRAIKRGDYKNIHSVLLARGGLLVLEEYFQGYDRGKPHQIRSATKTIGAVLIGIAIDRGYLPGVHEPIFHFFREQTTDWGDRARAVTIKSLLTMSSGFDCDDHRGESFQCEKAMYQADGWVSFALNLPMAYQPGKHWAYNSTSLILLSEIITQSTGLPVPKFADKYLMGPLGIIGFRWGFSPEGKAWLGGNASMRPRDMLKFGQMCLDKGL